MTTTKQDVIKHLQAKVDEGYTKKEIAKHLGYAYVQPLEPERCCVAHAPEVHSKVSFFPALRNFSR